MLALVCTSAYGGSQTDYRNKILGSWRCESVVETEQGRYRVEGYTRLNPEGSMSSQGNIFVYNAMLNMELPMKYSSEGSWVFENLQLKGHVSRGNIETGYPVLDKFADVLESQVMQDPYFSARLTKIGDNAMVFEAEDKTLVICQK